MFYALTLGIGGIIALAVMMAARSSSATSPVRTILANALSARLAAPAATQPATSQPVPPAPPPPSPTPFITPTAAPPPAAPPAAPPSKDVNVALPKGTPMTQPATPAPTPVAATPTPTPAGPPPRDQNLPLYPVGLKFAMGPVSDGLITKAWQDGQKNWCYEFTGKYDLGIFKKSFTKQAGEQQVRETIAKEAHQPVGPVFAKGLTVYNQKGIGGHILDVGTNPATGEYTYLIQEWGQNVIPESQLLRVLRA
jgi:hypothetical protein